MSSPPLPASWLGLALDPLDTLFFRDGRPFEPTNRVQSGLPTPQTLAGALRTALLVRSGFNFRKLNLSPERSLRDAFLDAGARPSIVDAKFRGPFLALRDDAGKVEPILAAPAVLARGGGPRCWSWSRPLSPREHEQTGFAGWTDPDGLWPLARDVPPDPKAERPWVSLAGIRKFLEGHPPGEEDCHSPTALFGHDRRVGNAIQPDSLTTVVGQLYAISLLSLQPRVDHRRVCIYAEVLPGNGTSTDFPTILTQSPIPFGGEGRHVAPYVVPVASWPTMNPSRRASVWYLATPTFLPRRESNRVLPACSNLRGAASGAGMAVSGWDLIRNGPRATRFAVPPGAVYYMAGPGTPDDFLDVTLPDCSNLKSEGWGFALQGTWHNEDFDIGA